MAKHLTQCFNAALMLGFNLTVLLSYLKVEPLEIELAIEGIERAIEALYPRGQLANGLVAVYQQKLNQTIDLRRVSPTNQST